MANRKKKVLLRIIITSVIIFILISSGFVICIKSVKILLNEGNEATITEISDKNAIVVEDKIKGTFDYMKCISNIFSQQSTFDIDSMLSFLKTETERTSFLRMGIINSEGILKSTDNISLNVSNTDYFNRAMNGDTIISREVIDTTTKEKVFIYTTPLLYDGAIKGVIYGTVLCDNMEEILLSNAGFEGKVKSCIIDKDGNIVVGAKNSKEVVERENIFTNEKSNEESDKTELENFKQDLISGNEGTRVLEINGKKSLFSYSKVENLQDHYVLSQIEQSIISDKDNHIRSMMILLGSFISIIFVMLLIYINEYRNKKEKLIKDIAFVDDITGGKTLMKFKMDIKELLSNNKNGSYALVEFDINRFKIINDIWGYKTGNLLLKHISEVLEEKLCFNEMFCRVRDDLFIMLLNYSNYKDMLERLKVLDNDIRFFEKREPIPNFTLSYGAYVIDESEADIQKMIDNTALARETSKNNCNSIIAFYDTKLQNKLIKQKQIEDVMHSALISGEFEVYLQPKYDIKLGVSIGAEALVRWRHPTRGLISPINFIPLFEKNGFIVNLDMFIFEQVCIKLNEWKGKESRLVPISVNISRVNLKNVEYFIKNITRIFDKYDISPSLIEIEITESAVFDDYENIFEALSKLKEIGFSISLDDFGTGFSSLNILKDLPIDIIKLDREFLNSKDSSKKGEIVIENIVRMANELDLTVICEGVETHEQAEFLNKVGCNRAQGYLYARPMPVRDFEETELWPKS
ncbi:bifunctional diguanylate cyclase/phosphodiesterase [Clostridium uliginosum]|uniref:Diguanylate cyclase (GGDEF) domain-containing protein n=1 Tax=Clostridium uliginosum TaxID=119641 RepID=A0A1I1L3C4_9CLOT|nr:GGDEF domain-containing protein [Clostridium uliginosum]SFC67587.1 diguanylate cyclase (GGDEF) domain-containing protein [Clostridium uliginosum]